jgi:hypothetical protein
LLLSPLSQQAEWERKRQAYASTVVDSQQEALAVSEIVSFAELHGHATAESFVGHWHFHGEGGLVKSLAFALRWYERAASHGNPTAAAARDKMYLDGLGCDPASGASQEQTERAVSRLRAIATPATAEGGGAQNGGYSREGSLEGRQEEVITTADALLPLETREAARRRLVDWGYDEEDDTFWAPPAVAVDSATAVGGIQGGGSSEEGRLSPSLAQPETVAVGGEKRNASGASDAERVGSNSGGGGGGDPDHGDSSSSSSSSSVGFSIPVPAKQQQLRDQMVRDISASNPALGLELQRERERKDLAKELVELGPNFGQQQGDSSLPPSADGGGSGGGGVDHGFSRGGEEGGSGGGGGEIGAPSMTPSPFGGGGYGMPPRRWTPFFAGHGEDGASSGSAVGGTPGKGNGHGNSGGGSLRTAADVAAAAPAPGAPRGLAEASLEADLSLQCVMASRNYDEYMVMLETLKVQHLQLQDPSSLRPNRPPLPLLPDDALTYGILQRDKLAEDSRIAALCDPSTVGHGSGFKIPAPVRPGDALAIGSVTNRQQTLREGGGAGGGGGRSAGGGGGVSGFTSGLASEPLGGLVHLGGGGYAGGSVDEMSVLRGGRRASLAGLTQVVQGNAGGGFLVGAGPRNQRGGHHGAGNAAAGSGGGGGDIGEDGGSLGGHSLASTSDRSSASLLKPTEARVMYKMTLA